MLRKIEEKTGKMDKNLHRGLCLFFIVELENFGPELQDFALLVLLLKRSKERKEEKENRSFEYILLGLCFVHCFILRIQYSAQHIRKEDGTSPQQQQQTFVIPEINNSLDELNSRLYTANCKIRKFVGKHKEKTEQKN